MNILVDIGHPGQVHYFKNALRILEKNNHKILIIARDREFIQILLKKYGFDFIDRGKGRDGIVGKFTYMFQADYLIWREAKKFKPDLFLSFSSPYASQVAFLMRKPHIALNDTEHTDTMHSIFTYPFCNAILTPSSFGSDLGKKQIRFENVVEGFYLHKNYFKPDLSIYDDLGIEPTKEFAVLRFVSWKAHHDIGQEGLHLETKKELINILSKRYQVFITSEAELPDDLQQYKLKISPDRIHDVLAFATLFVGESSTMGSESALLGTMAIVINPLPIACNIRLEEQEGVARYFQSTTELMPFIKEFVQEENQKEVIKSKSNEMQEKFIDATKFLVWFIENFPKSFELMKNDNKYQNKFKYKK